MWRCGSEVRGGLPDVPARERPREVSGEMRPIRIIGPFIQTLDSGDGERRQEQDGV